MNENNKRTGRIPTKAMLTMRLVIGAYLIYLAYGLGKSVYGHTADSPLAMVVFAVLFTVGGIWIIWMSVRDLMNGNYSEGGFGAATQEDDAAESDDAEDEAVEGEVLAEEVISGGEDADEVAAEDVADPEE